MVRIIFIYYFNNSNGNISPGAVTWDSLINLAAEEKTKPKNILELQYSTGEYKNKIENHLLFFFNFQKIGSGGSVKQKIKKQTLA